MNDETLCPFSKPLVGQWCQCPHAILMDRCSGKMQCGRESDFLDSCQSLVDVLRQHSRFVLGLTQPNAELTHTQLMKIRCGGLQGMSREMGHAPQEIPAVRIIYDQVIAEYGNIDQFPFDKILKDIQSFSHRKQKSRPK